LQLYLASGSPRRLDLLRRLGLDPTPLEHRVDERVLPGEEAEAHARRLARAKGRDATSSIELVNPAVVLSADTVVTLDGAILGKPEDRGQAERMLRRLRGRRHRVVTAIWVFRTDDGRESSALESTAVRFRDFDEASLQAYVESGEPMDKAGAYGIQGRGVFLTERIEGSWSNVVGLPLEQLPGCLVRIGIDPLGLFRGRLTSR
jgi:septum formation protein